MNNSRTVQLHARLVVAFVATVVAFLIAGATVLATPASAYAASTTAELTATKVLDGGTLEADQFEFTIEAVTEGAPMPEKTTATNDAEGNISFGNATYTAAGTYEYKVTETEGDDSTITYDTKAKTITVTVTETPADASGSATPNNGDNYLPQKHATGTTSAPITVSYNHGGDPDEGWYSDKSVTFDADNGGAIENVFCGVSYKSGSGTDYPTRTIWNGDLNAFQAPTGIFWGIEINGEVVALIPTSDERYRWIDNVAYLYTYDYFQRDNANASGAWSDSSDPDVMYGWGLLDAVQKVMWNGYPYNAGNFTNVSALRKTTQEALFFVLKCGQGYKDGVLDSSAGSYRDFAPDQDMFDKLINYALKGEGGLSVYPEGTETYVYWNTVTQGESTGINTTVPQPLIGMYAPYEPQATLSAEATTAAFTNTQSSGSDDEPTTPTVKTSAKGASGNTIEAAANQTITDTVTLSGLTSGVEYTISGILVDENDTQVGTCDAPVVFTADSAKSTQTVTFTFDATDYAGKKLVVCETLTWTENGEEKSVEHHDLDDTAQTITVNNPGGDEPTPELKTTIKVAGTTATSDALLTLPQQNNTVAVIDTIDYSNLTAGATYAVKGELMRFSADNAAGECVATVERELTASDSGSGTWVLNFGTNTLSPNSYYVVYETATNKDDASDTASHKDPSDLSQAVAVEEVPDIEIEIPDHPNEPPFNPTNPEYPMTPISELSMGTTVSINGQAATANAARTVSYADVSKVKTVNDSIAYEGFGANSAYTVRGELREVVSDTETKLIKEATISGDATAVDPSGKGTWTMSFSNVTLEAGKKYVVFEYATDEQGNEVASHADPKDLAQTIVVTAKPTSTTSSKTASTTAKTADNAGGVALMALIVAVVAAGTALGARRKSER